MKIRGKGRGGGVLFAGLAGEEVAYLGTDSGDLFKEM